MRACRACADLLPLGPRPILQIGGGARVLITSQAPGRKAHRSGIPFDDASGATLRAWLGIDRRTFYDPEAIAILPMAFCYPGRGAGGDLAPAARCAPLWHARLRPLMPAIALTLVIGRHAQRHRLHGAGKATLTETVRAYRDYLPDHFPLPHPSPRNRPWLLRHPWFEAEVVPALRAALAGVLAGG